MDRQPPPLESLPHLPSELIILEILPRLPVKSLLRFRCVSKSWLSLISSQNFIKSHLEKSSNNKDYPFHSLIAQSSGPPFTFKNCSVRSLLLRDPVANGTSVDFPVKNTSGSIYVVGSCNGLICIILDFAQMYIWNPSTRKSKKLSDSGFIRTQRWYTVYGFGYDETSDDYNVVIMFREFNHVKIETKVYSLKSDRWRSIEDFPGFFPIHCKQGKYVDGKLHWPGYSGKEARGVVSFDLAQAKYGEVKLPISGERVSHPVLGVLGKCLCVMYKHQWFSVDLWLMKEYGVMESWIKILTFTSFEIDSLVPLCISRDGEVLIQFGSTFKWYNLQDGSAGYDKIMSMNKRCDATIYVESLVSPNANDEHERQDG